MRKIKRIIHTAENMAKKCSPDLSKLHCVRIDEKTVIFVKPGISDAEAKANFLKKLSPI